MNARLTCNESRNRHALAAFVRLGRANVGDEGMIAQEIARKLAQRPGAFAVHDPDVRQPGKIRAVEIFFQPVERFVRPHPAQTHLDAGGFCLRQRDVARHALGRRFRLGDFVTQLRLTSIPGDSVSGSVI